MIAAHVSPGNLPELTKGRAIDQVARLSSLRVSSDSRSHALSAGRPAIYINVPELLNRVAIVTLQRITL